MRAFPASIHLSVYLLIAVLAAACDHPTEGREHDTTVTVLDPANEIIFNPVWDMWAKFLLFAPLMSFDENGELEPRLARSWEHSPDYKEWTYHLRSDVSWHDGVPFTAHDVKFSLELMAHPDILYFPRLEEILVPDDSTVILRSGKPSDGLDWWTVYYPKHLLEDEDPASTAWW